MEVRAGHALRPAARLRRRPRNAVRLVSLSRWRPGLQTRLKVVDRFANLETRALQLDVCVTGRIEQKTGFTVRVDDMKNLRGFFRPAAQSPKPDLTGVTRPRLLAEVKPKYTREAMQAKIQGVIEVAVTIRADGGVENLRIVKSLDALLGLDDQALIAASGWRFEPARKQGHAIPYDVVIQLEFRLH